MRISCPCDKHTRDEIKTITADTTKRIALIQISPVNERSSPLFDFRMFVQLLKCVFYSHALLSSYFPSYFTLFLSSSKEKVRQNSDCMINFPRNRLRCLCYTLYGLPCTVHIIVYDLYRFCRIVYYNVYIQNPAECAWVSNGVLINEWNNHRNVWHDRALDKQSKESVEKTFTLYSIVWHMTRLNRTFNDLHSMECDVKHW